MCAPPVCGACGCPDGRRAPGDTGLTRTSTYPKTWATLGGCPLGMQFDGNGHLWVADAVRGLLRVDPTTRKATIMASHVAPAAYPPPIPFPPLHRAVRRGWPAYADAESPRLVPCPSSRLLADLVAPGSQLGTPSTATANISIWGIRGSPGWPTTHNSLNPSMASVAPVGSPIPRPTPLCTGRLSGLVVSLWSDWERVPCAHGTSEGANIPLGR